FVAAASKGLGKAVAMRLAEEGANVSICARDSEVLESAVAEISAAASTGRVFGIPADLTQADDIERIGHELEKEMKGVDILVNNAGGPSPGVFESLSDRDWQDAFELTLMSTVRLTRLMLPHMRAQKWGRIINI
ncbi:MAG: SDR family NAD(P)-dependent oxidoreductase, partial [Woeseiaceae bacterium]|nr:SDR family NAD(P)-dependent oxidoreductase [Woeseiaceae bacterium]NIP20879.1 SDR family NAD(P)-dependent oxidoreductase [Woeseiaceae bacterium]